MLNINNKQHLKEFYGFPKSQDQFQFSLLLITTDFKHLSTVFIANFEK